MDKYVSTEQEWQIESTKWKHPRILVPTVSCPSIPRWPMRLVLFIIQHSPVAGKRSIDSPTRSSLKAETLKAEAASLRTTGLRTTGPRSHVRCQSWEQLRAKS